MNQTGDTSGAPVSRSPGDSEESRWLTVARSPYFMGGAAVVASLIVGTVLGVVSRPRPPERAPQQVALATPIIQPEPQPVPSPAVQESPEAPVVTIRPLAERKVPKPVATTPGLDQPGSLPLSGIAGPTTGPLPVPGTNSAAPGAELVVPDLATPEVGTETLPTMPAETTPPVAPRVETSPAEPEPTRRPRVAARPVPIRPNGKLSIYFDADSSTFDRGKNRAPLRVEVFVGGRKVMESNDPEKREFAVADLPEGVHEISIVPHVGNAQPRPRHFRVEVDGNGETRVEAVLRRRDGEALVGKLRARD